MTDKILVAMSGGVDSSVTAAELAARYPGRVVGVTMALAPRKDTPRPCCTPSDARDAATVAQKLNIPHYVWDFSQEFKKQVMIPFASGYEAGITPNPCLACNIYLKYDVLLTQAKRLGAKVVATGHYARLEQGVDGRFQLWAGVDTDKDQAYFLYALTQAQLAAACFPLGEWTKETVRKKALSFGLKVAEKPESQDICFVGEEGYAKVVEEYLATPPPSGEIVDLSGKVLGHHSGIHHFTVGQRRGLGVAAKTPLYVLRVDPKTHRVVVGPQESLVTQEIFLDSYHETSLKGIPRGEVKVRLRHRGPLYSCELREEGGRVFIDLKAPVFGVSPGQAAVLFQGEMVLGGGIIGRLD